MRLHGYFRSSASWRVRIALALKGMEVEQIPHHLRRGEQRDPAYLALNPQGLVPTLALADGDLLTQSLAIILFLDALVPAPPLLPADPLERGHVLAFAQVIACEIHPLQNLETLQRLRVSGLDETAVTGWARDVIDRGLDACETLLAGGPGPFCFGAAPTLADIFLVPQLGNARRFGVDLRWPRLLAAEAAASELPAFRDAAPERQPDAE